MIGSNYHRTGLKQYRNLHELIEKIPSNTKPYRTKWDPIDGYLCCVGVQVLGETELVETRQKFMKFLKYAPDQSPKCFLALSTVRKNEKFSFMTGYMIIDSEVLVMHADVDQIPQLIEFAADEFIQAIQWDGNDVEKLIKHAGLFRYFSAQATYYNRGSAAIGEWFEKLVYLYHNFLDFCHQERETADLIAFSSLSIQDYLRSYRFTFEGVE